MEGHQRDQGEKQSLLSPGFTVMDLQLLFWIVSTCRGLSERPDFLSLEHLQQEPAAAFMNCCFHKFSVPSSITYVGAFVTAAVESEYLAITLPQDPHGGLLMAGNSWCLI